MLNKIQPFRLLAWLCLLQVISAIGTGLYFWFFVSDHLWVLLIPIVFGVVFAILTAMFFKLKPSLQRYRFFKFFFLIQIPYFDFNVISYKFGFILPIFFEFCKTCLDSGGSKYSYKLYIDQQFLIDFSLDYSSFFSSFETNLLGINLFALIIFVLFRRAQKQYTLALQTGADFFSEGRNIDKTGRPS